MALTQPIYVSGNPVTVGMSIHISSIDQISEVNMVSLERERKRKKERKGEKTPTINCSSIFWLGFTSKAVFFRRHLDLCWHLWSLWHLISSRVDSYPFCDGCTDTSPSQKSLCLKKVDVSFIFLVDAKVLYGQSVPAKLKTASFHLLVAIQHFLGDLCWKERHGNGNLVLGGIDRLELFIPLEQ